MSKRKIYLRGQREAERQLVIAKEMKLRSERAKASINTKLDRNSCVVDFQITLQPIHTDSSVDIRVSPLGDGYGLTIYNIQIRLRYDNFDTARGMDGIRIPKGRYAVMLVCPHSPIQTFDINCSSAGMTVPVLLPIDRNFVGV